MYAYTKVLSPGGTITTSLNLAGGARARTGTGAGIGRGLVL